MPHEALWGMLLPFAGTSLGAAFVFFMKKGALNDRLQRGLSAFAAGIMLAAAFFSLLLPAIRQSEGLGAWAFLPASVGLCLGMAFLSLLNHLAPEARCLPGGGNGPMILAVTLHNLPEGMAVGIIYAGWIAGDAGVSLAAAAALTLGISAQNVPEGAIVALPLRASGMSRGREFFCGVLSGAVEPVGALIALLFTGLAASGMPWLLSFAAGAMLSVVMGELIPDMRDGGGSQGEVGFAAGFVLMIALDVGMG